jgi:hypothetical protein
LGFWPIKALVTESFQYTKMADTLFLLTDKKRKSSVVRKAKKVVEEHPKQAFSCKGQPVFKIGFDKYVTVRKDSELKFVIGEWIKTSHNEWLETNKQIALSLDQFNKLSGLLLSGQGDWDDLAKNAGCEDGKLTPLYALGSNVYLGWSRYNRTNVVTIRKFYVSPKNDILPTKHGITFGVRCYEGLKDLIRDMTIYGQAAKLDAGQDKAALTLSALQVEVPQMLFKILQRMRESTDLPRPEDEEWKQAEQEVLNKKLVEGVLLTDNQVSPGQLAKLDTQSYLDTNRGTFQAAVKSLLVV